MVILIWSIWMTCRASHVTKISRQFEVIMIADTAENSLNSSHHIICVSLCFFSPLLSFPFLFYLFYHLLFSSVRFSIFFSYLLFYHILSPLIRFVFSDSLMRFPLINPNLLSPHVPIISIFLSPPTPHSTS
jgi:integral membrane sensor domain MASE1